MKTLAAVTAEITNIITVKQSIESIEASVSVAIQHYVKDIETEIVRGVAGEIALSHDEGDEIGDQIENTVGFLKKFFADLYRS